MKPHYITVVFLSFSISVFCQFSLILQPGGLNGKDCEIFSLQPNTNQSSIILRANAWTFSGNFGIQRSLLGFDLSYLPSDAIIDSAFLSLYSPGQTANQPHSGNNACILKRITSNWNEESATWENQPTVTNQNQVEISKSINGDQNYEKIDVLNLIRDMVAQPNSNHGFMLSLISETPLSRMSFCSSEHPDVSKRPKLVVYYKLPSCTYIKLKPDINNVKDAEVFSLQPDINLNPIIIRANNWSFSGNQGLIRGLIEFDLGNIPDNAMIKHANLSLFSPDEIIPEFHSGSENAAFISRITDNWVDNTVNWNNQPSFSYENQVKLESPESPRQDFTNINMTKLIQDHTKYKNSSHGFMLHLIDENFIYNRIAFCSSEYPNEQKRPILEVCYLPASTTKDEITCFVDIYPNPTNSFLNVGIKSINRYKQLNYVIIDNLGRPIKSANLLNEIERIDLTNLLSGLYNLLIYNKEVLLHSKSFVKI